MTENHPGPGEPVPPQPGIVPLRPLDAGEIVGGLWRFLRRTPWTVLPGLLYAVVVLGTLWLVQPVGALQPANPFDLVGTFLEATLSGLPFGLVAAAVAPLVLAAVLPAVTSAVYGSRTGIAAAWAQGRPRLPALYGVQLAQLVIGLVPIAVGAFVALPLWRAGGVAAAAGLLLVVVVYAAQTWIAILLSLASPAVVAEGLGARDALWRSFELVRGAWWRCFGVLMLVGLTVAAAATVVMIPVFAVTFALMFTVSPTLGLAVAGVAYVLLLGLVVPVSVAAPALLHHDQRGRRSGAVGPPPGERP